MLAAMAAIARPGPGAQRKEFSAETRRRLVAEATLLFTAKGYASTSLDEVVTAADVTKGALYHHFSSKLALFAAVFDTTQTDAVATISAAARTIDDPWERARVAVRAFMAVCQESTFRRVVMQEGPVALGFERFREADEHNTYGLIRGIVSTVLEPYDVPDGILDTFTRVFYGAMTAAGMSVAESAQPEEAGRQVETVIGIVLAGLRQLAESDAEFPSAGTTSRA
jgi:AcrR family transcriptional regulator